MKVIGKKVVFEDERGQITDILGNEVIESVTIISSKKGAVRGNHYHKESVQYTFVLKGVLRLLTQMPEEEVKSTIVCPGDLVFTPPMERHTLVAKEDSEFLVLTRGPRGGENYEEDTYRLSQRLEEVGNTLTAVKTSYVISGNPELEDEELPAILCNALGMSFAEFVEITLEKTRKAIKGRCGEYLEVRCHRTKKPRSGSCLRGTNMVVVGFCGDVRDLEVTLIHELLHQFQWDEKMVEAKAKEIYNGTGGGIE